MITRSFSVLANLLLTAQLTAAQSTAWLSLSPPPGQSSSLVAHPISGHMLMSTYADGLFRSTDAGSSWQQVYFTSTNSSFYSLAVRSDGALFAGGVGAVFRSTDGGNTWSRSTVSGGQVVSSIVFDGAGNLYVGTQAVGSSALLPSNRTGAGVFRSADDGQTWSAFNAGLAGTTGCVGRLHMSESGQLFAGLHDEGQTDNGGIFAWEQASGTWRLLPLHQNLGGASGSLHTVKVRYVHALALHNAVLHVALEGVANQQVYRLMMKSTNTPYWEREFMVAEQPMFSEQPYPYSLFVAKPASGGSVLIGHMSSSMAAPAGVYRLRSGAWQKDTGPVEAGRPLQFAQSASGQLFALEHITQKFFRTELINAVRPDYEARYAVQLFPNPARSETTLSYTLPLAAEVRVQVTDALGRMVLDGAPRRQPAGEHRYSWQALNAHAGLYLVKLWIGATCITKRLVGN
ncbi:T9SS type A sorting domain-containing protein [Hymenobacter sp. B81]|uniref:T9SS type A sorting domain-containing protein n=1 Tax=Hymenobacter sp. B81 TaxID=3344878 RepID=UPI0037DC27E5